MTERFRHSAQRRDVLEKAMKTRFFPLIRTARRHTGEELSTNPRRGLGGLITVSLLGSGQ